jgi:hypothetical protein
VPERIQLRRTKGWRLPPGAMVLARPSKWGNPWQAVPVYRPGHGRLFTIAARDGRPRPHGFPGQASTEAEARQVVVALFRELVFPGLATVARRELAARHLACWCPLGKPCHGDALLEIAAEAASA